MKRAWVIPLAVVLIIGLVIGGVMFSLYGFAVLSLTQAQFKTSYTLPNGDFWNKKLWILEVSQDALGHRASGVIYAEDVGDVANSDPPDQDFYIEMELERQSCEYPLYKESNTPPISSFNLEWWWTGLDLTCEQSEIDSRCPDAIASGKHGTSDCYCVEEASQVMAVDFNIQNPYTRTVSSIIVGNEDGWESPFYVDTIVDTQNGDTVSGFINDNIYVHWAGYHSTDFQCPAQNEIFAYESIDSYPGPVTSWKVGSRNKYLTYRDKYYNLQNELNSVGSCAPYTCESVFQSIVADLNAASNEAMESVSVDGYGNSFEVENNVLVREMLNVDQDPRVIKIPQYVFYIDADYLGIEVMAPDIDIVSVSQVDECFKGSGKIKVDLINNGHSGGTRLTIDNCPPGIEGATIGPVSVGEGETKTVYMNITASVSKKTTGTCTISSNDNYHIREKTFSVCAEPHQACTPGERKCVDEMIKECNEYGTGWITIEDCPAKCVGGECSMATGEPKCTCGGSEDCETDADCVDDDPCTINERCEAGWFGLAEKQCVSDIPHTVECGCPPYMLGPIPIPDIPCLVMGALQGVWELFMTLVIIGIVLFAIIIGGIVLLVRLVR